MKQRKALKPSAPEEPLFGEKRSDVTATVAPTAALSAADRCDRCGAQAYVRVELANGFELLFCAHHGRAHDAKLREVAANIHDESDKLTATPANAPAEEH